MQIYGEKGTIVPKDTTTNDSSNVIAAEMLAFKIYPNPGNGLVRIHNPYPEEYQLSIVSLSGKLVSRQVLPRSSELQLDLRHLKEGIYILNIYNQKDYFRQKLIIH